MPRKLRILCLHGFLQSAQLFRERTGSLRKALRHLAEFEYVTAPLTIAPSEIDGFADAGGDDTSANTWWYPNRDRTVYRDVDVSLRFLRTVFEQHGPFDGVLGFSQGASMVAMLCALRGQPEHEWLAFRFAVLVSGFRALDPAYAHLYERPIDVPTLHVFGDNDVRVSPERSLRLVEAFVGPTVYRHGGGHFVPSDAASKAAYAVFLERVALPDAAGQE